MAGELYSVRQEDFKGHTVYVLVDSQSGQEARVLPSVGNNCISYKIWKGDGSVELIYVPPDPETLQGRPSGYGVPILYPWPNRIDGGKFRFDGKDYQLDTPGSGEHASHGFVLVRPWQVESSGASTEDGAWIQSRFQSEDFPEVARQFPFPFEAVVVYRLKEGVLSLEFEGVNTGKTDMPAGLGIHPYFPLPIQENGNRDDCTVQMPVETYWPLRDDPIPTGEILPIAGTPFDVREPTSLKGVFFDNVWSGVQLTNGWSRCEYVDGSAGVKIVMEADSIFRELVLYAPEQRPIVCFEPYTCVTNAFNLQNQGMDAGLIRLKPGESFKGMMRILGEVIE
ncbi:MAG: aldose 1-epimerase [bacterium]|nr:aldose 1-epimerase [bacterium]